MNWLLNFLRNYLFPGVDDVDGEIPVDDDSTDSLEQEVAEGDESAEQDLLESADDEHPEVDEEPLAPRENRAQKAIRETRERAQNAERDLAAARAELEAARRPQQSTQPQGPNPDQVLWQQEEETLRNPEATDWQRYAIQANRVARQAQQQSQQALREAQDLADRTAFQAIGTTKPKTFAAYKDRVEARVQELRAKGINAPRELVLKTMLGEDMLAGKLKTSEKTKPATGAVRRAAPRTDVSAAGGGRLSESERRAKRLENVRI